MTERPSAAARFWAIIEHCSSAPDGIPFNELRRRCDDVVASTLSRQLDQLQAEGIVAKTPAGRYAAGPALVRLGQRLAGSRSAAELVDPLLAELSQACAASAVWWEREGDEVVLRARHDWPEGFNHFPLGTRRPLADSAFGSSILAACETLPELDGHFPNRSHKNLTGLRRELKAARDAGCCRREDHAPHGPISRICTAVTPAGRAPIGSLGITIPAPLAGLDVEALSRQVMTTARRAATALEGLA